MNEKKRQKKRENRGGCSRARRQCHPSLSLFTLVLSLSPTSSLFPFPCINRGMNHHAYSATFHLEQQHEKVQWQEGHLSLCSVRSPTKKPAINTNKSSAKTYLLYEVQVIAQLYYFFQLVSQSMGLQDASKKRRTRILHSFALPFTSSWSLYLL